MDSRDLPGGKSFRELRARQHQEELVRLLLTRYRLQNRKFDLLELGEQQLGEKRLTVAGFSLMFPSFPVYLGVQDIPNLDKATTASLLSMAFGKSLIYDTFTEFTQSCGDEYSQRSVGMIFRWLRLPPGMIAHNQPFDSGLSGVRFYWNGDNESLTIEPFKTWLRNLEWQPSD